MVTILGCEVLEAGPSRTSPLQVVESITLIAFGPGVKMANRQGLGWFPASRMATALQMVSSQIATIGSESPVGERRKCNCTLSMRLMAELGGTCPG